MGPPKFGSPPKFCGARAPFGPFTPKPKPPEGFIFAPAGQIGGKNRRGKRN